MPATVLADGLPLSISTWTNNAVLAYMGCPQQVHNVTPACLAAQQYAVRQDWLSCASAALLKCSKADSSAHLERGASFPQPKLVLIRCQSSRPVSLCLALQFSPREAP